MELLLRSLVFIIAHLVFVAVGLAMLSSDTEPVVAAFKWRRYASASAVMMCPQNTKFLDCYPCRWRAPNQIQRRALLSRHAIAIGGSRASRECWSLSVERQASVGGIGEQCRWWGVYRVSTWFVDGSIIKCMSGIHHHQSPARNARRPSAGSHATDSSMDWHCRWLAWSRASRKFI